jgi:ribose 5-phosphate isomerase B
MKAGGGETVGTKAIAIGCDEGGFELKQTILKLLRDDGYEVKDFGCYSLDPIDYPEVGYDLARAVARGEHDRGILICGTGIGMAIVANKVPGVRAAQIHDSYSAERARKSNNAQIMTMGGRVVGPELAKSLVRIWLASEFTGGNSARKVDKIMAGEQRPGPPGA